jgi:type 1 glutamine amidotransferase
MIKTAVVTGGHAFDVMAFHTLLHSLPEVDPYLQALENLAADTERVLDQYDVFVFYNMHTTTPEGKVRATLEQLGQSNQGIVIWHHALLAFPEWKPWSRLVGIGDRSLQYYHDETLDIEIADPGHPITAEMAPWTMVDETYKMANAGDDSHILLTTDHPKSMRTLAWTRQVGQARVFCLESGHDHITFADPNFQTVLGRGIAWTAHQI